MVRSSLSVTTSPLSRHRLGNNLPRPCAKTPGEHGTQTRAHMHLLEGVERVVLEVRVELVLERASDVVQVLDLLLALHKRSRGGVLGLGTHHRLLFHLLPGGFHVVVAVVVVVVATLVRDTLGFCKTACCGLSEMPS